MPFEPFEGAFEPFEGAFEPFGGLRPGELGARAGPPRFRGPKGGARFLSREGSDFTPARGFSGPSRGSGPREEGVNLRSPFLIQNFSLHGARGEGRGVSN